MWALQTCKYTRATVQWAPSFLGLVTPSKYLPPTKYLPQLAGCGSTFYASGYEDGNNDGLVLMQTLSGVTQDGQEVIAVVAPGKFSAGSSVLVEARHLVDKPKGLDWERAAMLPFLVRI